MASDLDALRPAIKAVIDGLALGIPVHYQGETFKPPAGMWMRVSVLWGRGRMESGGTGVSGNALPGSLMLSLFDAPRGGMAALEAKADVLRSAFSRVKIGAAFFFAPSGPVVVEDASQDQSAKWNQVAVSCPFELREA